MRLGAVAVARAVVLVGNGGADRMVVLGLGMRVVLWVVGVGSGVVGVVVRVRTGSELRKQKGVGREVKGLVC